LNIQASQRSPNQKPIPLPEASTNISGEECWEIEKGGWDNRDDGHRIEGENGNGDGHKPEDDDKGDNRGGATGDDMCCSQAG